MEKMNQVSVSEFFAKSKEEMYDMAVDMVEKYNRLVDICNDSAERMADLIEIHVKKVDELEKESEKWKDLAKMNRDTICDQYNVCEEFKNKIAELEKENEKLKVDLVHEREKNEKLARAHAELENDMRKYTTEIKTLEEKVKHQRENLDGINKTLEIRTKENESLIKVRNNQNKEIEAHESENARLSEKIIELKKENSYLKKELDKTCTCKELDLKGHNRREMALVNELADKNDEIKSLKEENSYLKSEIKQKQNIIKKAYERYSDDIIKTRKDLMEVAYRDIEKDNGYVGFKLYVKSALIEAKGDKNEANEVITEAVRSAYTEWDKTQKENEKTIKKAIKEVMNKKYGYAGEIAFRIRSEVDKKRIVDIGEGAEKILGVSRELFDAAIKALVDDGYQEIIGRIPQATNSYVYMDMHVLATPDVETKETANAEAIKSLDFDIPCGEDAIE